MLDSIPFFLPTWYDESEVTVSWSVQAAADAQKIGRLFSVVENYQILNNYSQPFKQSTTDEIVGFVAALAKVGKPKIRIGRKLN